MTVFREDFKPAAAKLECDIIEMDGEADHVHLLVTYPPKLAVSVMVNNLKSVSSCSTASAKYPFAGTKQNRVIMAWILLCL